MEPRMSIPRFTSEHRVGVLMGGLSPERAISMKSGKAVAEASRSRGYNVIEIVVNRDIATVLEQTKIDVAWLALHGTYGEDGCIQGLLEIPAHPLHEFRCASLCCLHAQNKYETTPSGYECSIV